MATLSLENRILTLTDGDTTSSVDLSEVKGDTGCRGAQGRAGVIIDANGNVDMSGYATETYVDEQIVKVQTGGTIDLGNYATKAELEEAISNIDISGIDLSEYALKEEIPSLDGYATEDYVAQAIANAQLGGGEVDLSIYALKSEVPTDDHINTLIDIKLGVIENGTY